MKRFVGILSIYIIASILVSELLTYTNVSRVIGHEFRAAEKLSKSKSKKKVKKLIIGDSTGYALYPCTRSYDSIVSLACGTSISMGGHYFLLKNYLDSNPDNPPEEVVLLLTPMSFSNDLDKYAYQYFLKPFPIWEYKPLYTDHLYQRVKSIPYYWTAYLPFIHSSGYTPEKSVPKKEPEVYLSRTCYEYLLQIDSITKANGIPLRMISSPVRDDYMQRVENISKALCEESSVGISHLAGPYIETINYYPANLFHDEVHLERSYVPADYLGILGR
ncbi:MAG: hypothetical protein IJT12_07720 [Paludibacteraceae bacterium]|nr:hypothetical protein [Paludibacteraceae bacterium]